MSAPEVTEDPELQAVAWDLDPLLDGRADDPDAAVGEMLAEVQRRADAFAEAYAGKVAELDGARPRGRHARAGGDPGAARPRRLLRDPATSPATPPTPRAAPCCRSSRRARPAIETRLLFFELEWAALDDDRAEELLADRRARLRAPPPAHRAPLPPAPAHRARGEDPRREGAHRPHGVDAAVRGAGVGDHRRARRRRRAGRRSRSRSRACSRPTATSAATPPSASPSALQPGLRTRAYVLNTLLADKMVEDRLRHYPHWLASRNLANEASDESVEALIQAVRDRYELPRRWYRLKARLLGLDRSPTTTAWPPSPTSRSTSTGPARATRCSSTYRAFSDELGALVQRFFDESWIDAPVRPNKRGGAFCAYTVPSSHPYVLLNYTHTRRDVLTLAHELGHGVHAALGARQGVFHMATPLTMAETASVFGETLVFGRLLEQAETPESRLALLAESIEGSIATVFRQVAMNRFEHLVHTERRDARRAGGRADRRAVGRVADRAAGRRRRGDRGLPLVVVVRAALHQHARLRLRLRLRAAARARRLRPLRGAGRELRARLPGPAQGRRLAQPRGARAASSASTSRIPGSGTAGSTSWSASSTPPRPRRARRGGSSRP